MSMLSPESKAMVLAVRDVIESRLKSVVPTVNNQPANVRVVVDMTPVADALDRMVDCLEVQNQQMLVSNELTQQLLVVLSNQEDPVVNVHPPNVSVAAPVVNVKAPNVRVDGAEVRVPAPSAPVFNESPRPTAFRVDVDKNGVKRLVPEYK